MSSIALLDKTRKIGRLLHNTACSKVIFSDICDVMQDVLASDVFVSANAEKYWDAVRLPACSASVNCWPMTRAS